MVNASTAFPNATPNWNPANLPNPPYGNGCYYYSQQAKMWEQQPCASEDSPVVAPLEGGGPAGVPIYGDQKCTLGP